MGFIKSVTSKGSRPFYLAKSSGNGTRQTFRATDKKVDRVDPLDLEAIYIRDCISFNAVNKAVQMITASADFEIVAQDKGVKKFFDDFFDRIGDVGEEMTKDELLERIFKDLLVYGNSYVELIYDSETDSKVVDLAITDAKRMDFARNALKDVAVDENGKPLGYTLEIPYGYSTAGRGDQLDIELKNKINLDGNKIFLLPRRIAHFKLYTIGDGFLGIGLLEPAYQSTIRKLKIEEAQTNSIYTRGTYPVVAKVGNVDHEPTKPDLDNVLETLSNMKHDRYFAFPYWVEVNPLEVKQSDIVDNTLNLLRTDQAASLGMPMAFATGAGEATNRATLNNQQQILELTLNDIVARVASSFRKQILRRIADTNDQPEVPYLKYETVGAEEKDAKSKRMLGYLAANVLVPQEVRDYALRSEGISKYS